MAYRKATNTLSAALEEIDTSLAIGALLAADKCAQLKPIIARKVAILPILRADQPSVSHADVLAMLAPQKRRLHELGFDMTVHAQMVRQEIDSLDDEEDTVVRPNKRKRAAIVQNEDNTTRQGWGPDTNVSSSLNPSHRVRLFCC